MVLHYDQIVPTAPAPGITRRILARGGAMMGVEASFKKDAVGAAHRHPHEQVSYVVSGSFDQLHGARALEDAVILDIFTPQREDFL